MQLRHEELEQELKKLGWKPSRAQRLKSDTDLQWEAQGKVDERLSTRGALVGGAFGAVLGLAAGPAWPAVAACGALVGTAMASLAGLLPGNEAVKAELATLAAARDAVRRDLDHARQVLATALKDPEDDQLLLRAVRAGAVDVDGPGMATALKQRIEARAAVDADQDAARAADAAAGRAAARALEDQARLDKARTWRGAGPAGP